MIITRDETLSIHGGALYFMAHPEVDAIEITAGGVTAWNLSQEKPVASLPIGLMGEMYRDLGEVWSAYNPVCTTHMSYYPCYRSGSCALSYEKADVEIVTIYEDGVPW